jgi:dTDP-glucose pyrophosphorylase
MRHDWREILIGPSTTIKKAIEVIDKGTLRIALIVDEDEKLLGTVTDGDVRRALINGLSLSGEVSDIMARSPRVAAPQDSRESVLAKMEKYKLLHIPRVNESGCVVGLDVLPELRKFRKHENPVFLMAGGYGTRLSPLTDDCPKPLLKVGGKPILEIILESFITCGFYNFYISTHYMSEKVVEYFGDGSKWGVNIQYVYEDSPLGTGGALGLLPSDIPELPLLMMNGDILAKLNFEELLTFHSQQKSSASMCVRQYDFQIPYGVVQTNGIEITDIIEKPVHQFFVNAGIYVLEPHVFRSIKAGDRIDMPTLLSDYIAKDKKVSMFPVHEYWLDVGQMKDFERAQIDFVKDFK